MFSPVSQPSRRAPVPIRILFRITVCPITSQIEVISDFFVSYLLGQLAQDEATTAEATAQHFGYEMMLTKPGRVEMDLHAGDLMVLDIWGPVVDFGFAGEEALSALTWQGALYLTHTSATPIPDLLPSAVALLSKAANTEAS